MGEPNFWQEKVEQMFLLLKYEYWVTTSNSYIYKEVNVVYCSIYACYIDLLRSVNKGLLVAPKYNLKSYRMRAFSVMASLLWNNFPEDIRLTVNSLNIFKTKLTTFLFKRAYALD